jgi:hypothetical protein
MDFKGAMSELIFHPRLQPAKSSATLDIKDLRNARL